MSTATPARYDAPARVCFVGNAAIDRTVRVERLPVPGETVVALSPRGGPTARDATEERAGEGGDNRCAGDALDADHDAWSGTDFGGKGANQALICARTGVKTALFAALGQDAEGDRYLAHLAREGVDTRFLQRGSWPTDLSMITVDRHGENTIVTQSDASTAYRPDALAVLAATRRGDWVALQGNLLGDVTGALLREARRAGRLTFLNPGPVRFDCRPMLPDVDVLVVNQVEAHAIAGRRDPLDAVRALRDGGARAVCITLGARGVVYGDGAGTVVEKASATRAIDTVGAGDAFCGVLLAGLAKRLAPRAALRWAQAAAARTVARSGAQRAFPSSGELARLASLSSSFSADPDT